MEENKLTSYSLSRNWFDWCFENPEKIKPNHTALFFFCIEHCNRLGWKRKFGLPTTMAKEAIGIKSYNTYINTLRDLVDWGFIEMIEQSKNQYSANIIALSNFNKAVDKALDKALIKHASKQSESTRQSISSIDKPVTSKPSNQKEQINQNLKKDFFELSDSYFEALAMNKKTSLSTVKQLAQNFWLKNYFNGTDDNNLNDIRRHFGNWLDKQEIKKNEVGPGGKLVKGNITYTKRMG